jgi:hypothetical protein
MTDNKHAQHDRHGHSPAANPDPAHRKTSGPANSQGGLDPGSREAGRAHSAKDILAQEPLNPAHPGAPQPSGGLHSRPEPTNRSNPKH